jgi:site-specific DNA recombinase
VTGKVRRCAVYTCKSSEEGLDQTFCSLDAQREACEVYVRSQAQFNTTTSMGRLTLNVLLSFAQFEREVTGERIRDKIAASKRKGIWMGGNLPLGYDVKDRLLVVNETEAETVRYLFQRQVTLGTVASHQTDLKQHGIVSKVWTSSSGKRRGGLGYSRGALYYLLRNPIYIGRITHRDTFYAGQHSGIVPRDLWDRVEALLTENRPGSSRMAGSSEPRLLSGLLFDDRGNVMSPTHARKANSRRYRCYVSQAVHDQAGLSRAGYYPVRSRRHPAGRAHPS